MPSPDFSPKRLPPEITPTSPDHPNWKQCPEQQSLSRGEPNLQSTPGTNKEEQEAIAIIGIPGFVCADFARTLERELNAANEQLKPRSGHTFESLQKMWEDTHIELAQRMSELSAAKAEIEQLKKLL